MTPNQSPRFGNLNICWHGPSAKHSATTSYRSNWVASGPGFWVINTAVCHHRAPPPPTGGLADRWQRRQEVSDWVTLNKHWQLPDGWIWLTSVSHISAAGDPQPVSQHLAPGSLFSVCLLLCHSFSLPPHVVRALTLFSSIYLPWLCPCICYIQVNIFNTLCATCAQLLSHPKHYSNANEIPLSFTLEFSSKTKPSIITEMIYRKHLFSMRCIFDVIQ